MTSKDVVSNAFCAEISSPDLHYYLNGMLTARLTEYHTVLIMQVLAVVDTSVHKDVLRQSHADVSRPPKLVVLR